MMSFFYSPTLAGAGWAMRGSEVFQCPSVQIKNNYYFCKLKQNKKTNEKCAHIILQWIRMC